MLCGVLYFVYYNDKTDLQVNVKLMLRNFHLPRYLPNSQMERVHELVDQKVPWTRHFWKHMSHVKIYKFGINLGIPEIFIYVYPLDGYWRGGRTRRHSKWRPSNKIAPRPIGNMKLALYLVIKLWFLFSWNFPSTFLRKKCGCLHRSSNDVDSALAGHLISSSPCGSFF